MNIDLTVKGKNSSLLMYCQSESPQDAFICSTGSCAVECSEYGERVVCPGEQT